MAGHQLKKLAQSRNNGGFRWIEYMPKHWRVYTLLFCVISAFTFFFLFNDMRSSPTALLVQASRELGALRAQVEESYLSSVSRSSASEVGTEDHVGTSESPGNSKDLTWKKNLLSDTVLLRKNPGRNTSTPVIGEKESESEDLLSASAEEEDESRDNVKEKDNVMPVTDSANENPRNKDVAVAEEQVETFNLEDSPSQENIEERFADTAAEDEEILITRSEADALREPGDGGSSTSSDSDLSEVVQERAVDAKCDFSKGKWVYDENYPIYKPNTCAFLDGGFRCVENGRPNSDFQKWRWQPSGCDLPKFNPKEMLERLRGSRLVFVGDSIGRNNWESMLCLLAEGVANQSRIYEVNGESISKHSGFLIFRFQDYNFTVEYYRSPYLVPQGRPGVRSDPKVRSTLKLDTMDWSVSKWRDADIVVFNSGHWWSYGKTIRGGNYFEVKKNVSVDMAVHDAFKRAMQTVARYVEKTINPEKTKVFFRSYAPVHFGGGTWDHGGTCHGDTKPLEEFPFVYEDKTSGPMVAEVMGSNVINPITFLNITYLSDLRPDGHSSIYQRVPSSPMNHQDCSHWCLPGVPDTWNEILFAKLLESGQGRWGKRKFEWS